MYKAAVIIALAATLGVVLGGGYRGHRYTGYQAGHQAGYNRQFYGHWSYWSEWTYCSASCGGGTQSRTRDCQRPHHGYGYSKGCYGDDTETQYCHTDPCPVDGAWSMWGEFGDCSVECGHGTKTRSRTCTNPAPAYGGADCHGYDTDTTYCQVYKCPVDGMWSGWSHWSTCSGNCGEGHRVRNRSCSYPAPAHGGKACEGYSSEVETCQHYKKCGYRHHVPQGGYGR